MMVLKTAFLYLIPVGGQRIFRRFPRGCSGPLNKAGHIQNRNGTAQWYVCTRYGKYCRESQVLDGLRIDHEKVVQIITLLTEGLGIRGTARACDCHPGKVLNVLKRLAPGANTVKASQSRKTRAISGQ